MFDQEPQIEVIQIWVAAAMMPYRPNQMASDLGCNPDCERDASFFLLNDVELYAGFEGAPEETQLSDRNFLKNVTVLSGDLLGNDDDTSENSWHVVRALSTVGASARLDGFVIRDGNADASGNDERGGGINSAGSPTIVNCTITDNGADDGGGVFLQQGSSASFINCRIIDNGAGANGGGLARGELGQTDPQVSRAPTFTNCLIADNTAAARGGGLYLVRDGGPTIINCTIAENDAGLAGGGYFESEQFPGDQDPTVPASIIVNSILWGNSVVGEVLSGQQIDMGTGVVLAVDFSDVQAGEGSIGGDTTHLTWGANNIGEDLLLHDPQFQSLANGNYRLKCGSPARDSGDAAQTPVDGSDVDDDLDTTEKTPDSDLNFRVIDVFVDMGSFESHTDCPPGDCASPGPSLQEFGPPDGVVDTYDLAAIQVAMGMPGGPCDVFPACAGDGFVDQDDFDFARLHFGEQCGGGFPAAPGGPGGWGPWQDQPWAYALLGAYGLSGWDEYSAWVPVADAGEVMAFIDTLTILVAAQD